MTGNGEGDGIRCAGLRNGAHRLGRPDATRDLGIACGRAHRYRADRLPDTLLEGGATDVERKLNSVQRLLNEADDLGYALLETGVGADRIRPGKPVLQILHQTLRIVA